MALFREWGIQMATYLDDWLVLWGKECLNTNARKNIFMPVSELIHLHVSSITCESGYFLFYCGTVHVEGRDILSVSQVVGVMWVLLAIQMLSIFLSVYKRHREVIANCQFCAANMGSFQLLEHIDVKMSCKMALLPALGTVAHMSDIHALSVHPSCMGFTPVNFGVTLCLGYYS